MTSARVKNYTLLGSVTVAVVASAVVLWPRDAHNPPNVRSSSCFWTTCKAHSIHQPAPVQKAIGAPTQAKLPTTYGIKGLSTANLVTYVVQSGDSLNSIAGKLHKPWFAIYMRNRLIIEGAALSNGQPSSDGGNLIYTDEVLAIP